jgi:hypothetical protein
MKKILFGMIFLLALSGVHAQKSVSTGIEISFTYNRQSVLSSNQFALWIEDGEGKLVKTLFATNFTASGGWEKRPLSIPLWVEKSEPSTLSKTEIDAFTGATPRPGALKYRWDGTDKDGKRVAEGEYKVFLEATLRMENKVLYSASFTLGGSIMQEIMLRTHYSGKGTRERKMIENVRVFCIN